MLGLGDSRLATRPASRAGRGATADTEKRMRPPSSPRLLPGACLFLAAALMTTSPMHATAQLSAGAQDADTAEVAEARKQIAAGEYDAATELLTAWLERNPDDPGVRWLLARTLYWAGEFGAARRQLRWTLEVEPGYEPARDLWSEIRDLWASRVRIGLRADDDAQPIARQRLSLEGGLPLGPRVDMLARGELRRLDAPRPGEVTVVEGRGGVRADLPGVELEALAGTAVRPDLDGGDFVGSASLAVALLPRLALEAEGRRWSYESTSTAVDTAVMVETGTIQLARSDPVGWSGEVAARLDRFPDDNEVVYAWAWLLASLWSKGHSAVRVGYGFEARDAESSTFGPRPAQGGRPGPGGPVPGGGTRSVGVYDPYYTPEEVRVHSALFSFQADLSKAVLLAADGSAGVDAREDAPSLDAAAGSVGAPTVSFAEREFTPWRVRVRLSAELSPAATLRVGAGYREDAFYEVWHVSTRLEWRFLEGLRSP